MTVVRWESAFPGSVTGPWVIHGLGRDGAEEVYDVVVEEATAGAFAGPSVVEMLRSRMSELGYDPEEPAVDLHHVLYAGFLEIADSLDLVSGPGSPFVVSPSYCVDGPWAPDTWPWHQREFDVIGFDIQMDWEFTQAAWAPDAQQAIIDYVRDVVVPLAEEYPLQVCVAPPLDDSSDDLALLRAALPSFEEAGLHLGSDDLIDDHESDVVMVIRHRVLGIPMSVDLADDDDDGEFETEDEPDEELEEILADDDGGPSTLWIIWIPMGEDEVAELLDCFEKGMSVDDALEAVTGSRTF